MNVTNGNSSKGAIVAITLAMLAGCGGGGGSSGNGAPISTAGATITTPTQPQAAAASPLAANSPPSISGSPATNLLEGDAYSFQPTAGDADSDPLTFGASGLPAWLAINPASGHVSGTAPAGSSGSYGDIVLSVSDGKATVNLAVFTITVTAPVPTPTPTPPTNTAPTISGAPPPSVTAGQAYAFAPSAADADGDLLRFGIANKPAWATFDTATGRLTGTPTAADAGTYGNIVISVSDGKASATLPAFSVSVLAPVTGSAELRWTAPTQNEDGSALTNLAGYRIRYGASPTSLTQTVVIATAGTTSVLIEGLTAGTWYFTVASYTNTGVESAQTGAVSKTIG